MDLIINNVKISKTDFKRYIFDWNYTVNPVCRHCCDCYETPCSDCATKKRENTIQEGTRCSICGEVIKLSPYIDHYFNPDFKYMCESCHTKIKKYYENEEIEENKGKFLTLQQAIRIINENNGDLNLRNSNIFTDLPDNLRIERDLILSNSSILRLPHNLIVEGDLCIEGTEIKEFPDDLIVRGSLYLAKTKIKKLPKILNVNGNLDLRKSIIKTMPKELHVSGCLRLDDCKNVSDLPLILTVGEHFSFVRSGIWWIPSNLTVGGTMTACAKLSSLSPGMKIGGDLDLTGTHIYKPLKDTVVKGKVSPGYPARGSYLIPDEPEINVNSQMHPNGLC